MKLCTTCDTEKPLDQFYKSRGYFTVPCKACAVAKAAAWAAANPEAVKAASEKFRTLRGRETEYAKQRVKAKAEREKFADALRAKERSWYAANRERIAAKKSERRRANPEAHQAAQQRYRATEHGKVMQSERQHERRARLLRAIPAWADRSAIADMFRLARVLSRGGVKFSVDHIYPLKGKDVCGLHVFENLQVMTLHENIAKNNRVMSVEGEH